jgi:hypothetical protein
VYLSRRRDGSGGSHGRKPLQPAVRRLPGLVGAAEASTDVQLLQRVVSERDEAAFRGGLEAAWRARARRLPLPARRLGRGRRVAVVGDDLRALRSKRRNRGCAVPDRCGAATSDDGAAGPAGSPTCERNFH